MIPIQMRDIIDHLLESALADHYILEPGFTALLASLTPDDIRALPDLMKERAIRAAARLKLDINPDHFAFHTYLQDRLDTLYPPEPDDDELHAALMAELNHGWDEIE